MNRIKLKQITSVLAGISVIFPLYAGDLLPAASAEKAAVSIGNPFYTQVTAPVLKPLWSFSTATIPSSLPAQSITALAENGKVFALQKNYTLAALNAATGKKLWEYGSALAPLYTYSKGMIYGVTQTGTLYAVAESGRKVWNTSLPFSNASSIHPLGDKIYVTQGRQLAAVDASTGKLKWIIAEDSNYEGYTDLTEVDGVLIRLYTSAGVLTFPSIIAYDSKTGKKLWEQYRQSMPLTIRDGLVYSIKSLEMLDEDPVNRKVLVSIFNLQTGQLQGERNYRWTDNNTPSDGGFRSGGVYGSAFLDGSNLYVMQGQKVAQYNFWNYTENGKPLKQWNQPLSDHVFPLYKVIQDRLMYYNYSDNSLITMKLANGQVISTKQGENPSVQMDIFGRTMYTGQSDGLYHAYDLISQKPLFTVKTASREFQPSLKTGNILIVRSGGKMLGVKLPAAIQ
ncbi:PQQ-binding-like beta-propeller repeat protein [Paenibacillus sp. P32E]|uniref:outer membrane protein assembly factor BamB family protein n=1 Tax=Paenibacillus sp. P32E TaxID=1349434 RepID=UPI0009404C71|nr:PQQ-binding-like beta-propeller repeat protein [Paenibacillus sp. P32E]OKP94018.1 serine/threonine protein kinase [Paenibacillus sp. P32E]